MSDIEIRAKVKSSFFDREAIVRGMDAATRKAASQGGAFVRRTARSLIGPPAKKRAAPRPAGKPPRGHTDRLRANIFFSWDSQTKSVVIGPVPFGDGTAPGALERGGRSRMKVGRRHHRRTVTATVKPHPYMGPALTENIPKLPDLWANTLN